MEYQINCQCFDRKGIPFETLIVKTNDNMVCLSEMYESFSPEETSMGLPPADYIVRKTWIETICKHGESYLAMRGNIAVGHAALIINFAESEAEFLVYILKNHRRMGLGSELTRLAIQRAKYMGLKRIRLIVEKYNFPAKKLYFKFGFRFVEKDSREEIMILDLTED